MSKHSNDPYRRCAGSIEPSQIADICRWPIYIYVSLDVGGAFRSLSSDILAAFQLALLPLYVARYKNSACGETNCPVCFTS